MISKKNFWKRKKKRKKEIRISDTNRWILPKRQEEEARLIQKIEILNLLKFGSIAENNEF